MTEYVEINFTTRCDACDGLIRWIDCPTGGWWAHYTHPVDSHDARTAVEMEAEEASDGTDEVARVKDRAGALVLEHRHQLDGTTIAGPVAFAPALGADYWSYRVQLSDTQSIVGFPKFGTVGIGFAVEAYSGNTNLPYTCDTDQILRHISGNKGDDSIPDDEVRAAIALVQWAARTDLGTGA